MNPIHENRKSDESSRGEAEEFFSVYELPCVMKHCENLTYRSGMCRIHHEETMEQLRAIWPELRKMFPEFNMKEEI